MKILFITPSPPNDLNRIRSKNIIVSLSKLGHEICLVSLVKNEKELNSLRLMGTYVKEFVGIKQSILLSMLWCIFGLFSLRPLRVAYCYSKKLKKELSKEKYQNFDFIYIKRLRMAQYAKLFKNKDKIFIDLTDSMTKYYERLRLVNKGWRKILAWEEYLKHRWYEPKICRQYNHLIICSSEDRDYLANNFACNKYNFHVLENGINLVEWQYVAKNKVGNLHNLFFWGVMNVETNILSCDFFIKKVMPLLPNNFSLTIIGPKPGLELTKYSSSRIKFSGYVDNLSKISKQGIFVCPIITGAGVKNKIIQASLLGLPIVSTNLGIEGINDKLKKGLFIADKPIEFVKQINHILEIRKNELKILLDKQAEIACKYYDVFRIVKNFSDEFFI